MKTWTRRDFLTTAAVATGAGLGPSTLSAAPGPHSKELPDMLAQYFAERLNELAARWDRERENIRTPADLEARNRFVREKAIEMIHGLPERNPLDPVTVRTLDRDGYRIEVLRFQSRPNFWVTASLYVPTTGSGPFPGIISPCGHSANGRIYKAYQLTYLDLVHSGFVVLAYDPVGQGERRQYWNPQTGVSEVGNTVTWEHSLPGQLLLLVGEDLTHYRVWDGMRAIDYLLTRPEVDPKRIGCTGQSGGGTFTIFVSALDERVRCAAANEGGSGNQWPVRIRPETRLETGDTEQHFFPAAIYGIDRCDLNIAIAPRPLLVTIENYSAGFNAAAERIRERYRLLGVPEKFATEEATDPHAMSFKLRLATTNWFCRWFYGREGPKDEPEYQVEPAENLYCTPNGSIRYSRQGETIFSLLLKKQAQLPPAGSSPARAEDIKKVIRYPERGGPLDVRPLVTTPRRRYRIEKLEFLSEPGVYIPTWVFVPESAGRRQPILYVHEAGKEADGMEFGILERLARRGQMVVAVDVRGIGETAPPHPGEDSRGAFEHVDDIETVLTYMAWEMDESLFGMRVRDVVRSVDYALSRADAAQESVRVIGKGMGALWALFAAALDPRIQALVCDHGLLCYRALTASDRHLHGANVFIPDVLKHFDLPDVAAAVAPRPLALISPTGPMKQQIDVPHAQAAYQRTSLAYAGAAGRLRILDLSPGLPVADQYLELLGGPSA